MCYWVQLLGIHNMTPLLGTFSAGSARGYGRGLGSSASNQIAYTTAGTYTFTVPAGVTSISVVCVGAGQSSNGSNGERAGSGGYLAYANSISATPGESLTVVVGAPSTPATNNPGESSTIARGGTVLLRARGGGSSDTLVGTFVYAGGAGSSFSGWGGGGAGGYADVGGAGGAWGDPNGSDGVERTGGAAGGGGGGGFDGDYFSPGVGQAFGGGGGGGVGIVGQGSTGYGGAGGILAGGDGGGGGSGGINGSNASGDAGPGGAFGGGAGGTGINYNTSTYGAPALGGVGAVRIIWGDGRSYPSNAANI